MANRTALVVDANGRVAEISGSDALVVPANLTVGGGLNVSGGGSISGGLTTTTVLATSDVNIGGNLSLNGTLTLATQTANKVFIGPVTGSAAAPTFRLLQAIDLPTNNWITATNGINSLGADVTISAPSGTFGTAGIDTGILSAGTYLVTADVMVELKPNATTKTSIVAKLHDVFGGMGDIADSLTTCVGITGSATSTIYATAHITVIVVASGSIQLQLQVARIFSTTPTTSVVLGNTTDGATRIAFVKIK